jgi:3-hydroxyisobutyrate dehydrogenase-like beta-hydroxyacid dehydrogenase
MHKIGVIGLGNMGGAMARHLVDEGWTVVGYDIDDEVLEAATEYGMKAGNSPRAVAADVDIVLTSLPTPDAVGAVYLGDDGILAADESDLVALEMSTIAPATTDKIAAAAKHLTFIDAPLSGGPENARIGELTIMVGGDPSVADRELIGTVFETLGTNIYYLGGLGAGHTTKLLNNQIGAINRAASFEAAAIAASRGVDWKSFLRVVRNSSGSSYQFRKRMPQLLNRDFEPGYTVEAGRKDLRLALDMADSVDAHTPLTASVYELNKRAIAEGFDGQHITSLAKLFERSVETPVESDEQIDEDFLDWRDV